ncbi:hypothetical protein BC826DRAFT_229472 [Russula brevipes]|nr:hypothetical protein BC826DRAFT_229472 [Russula brevipes]
MWYRILDEIETFYAQDKRLNPMRVLVLFCSGVFAPIVTQFVVERLTKSFPTGKPSPDPASFLPGCVMSLGLWIPCLVTCLWSASAVFVMLANRWFRHYSRWDQDLSGKLVHVRVLLSLATQKYFLSLVGNAGNTVAVLHIRVPVFLRVSHVPFFTLLRYS